VFEDSPAVYHEFVHLPGTARWRWQSIARVNLFDDL